MTNFHQSFRQLQNSLEKLRKDYKGSSGVPTVDIFFDRNMHWIFARSVENLPGFRPANRTATDTFTDGQILVQSSKLPTERVLFAMRDLGLNLLLCSVLHLITPSADSSSASTKVRCDAVVFAF